TGASGAHLLVGGVGRDATGIAHGGGPDAGLLPERLLLTPEAAETEHRDAEALGSIGLDGVARHQVAVADREGPGVAAGQGRLGGGQFRLVESEAHVTSCSTCTTPSAVRVFP